MPVYAPEYVVAERRRYPALDAIGEALGGRIKVHSIPIPIDCSDGFTEAFYARPEAFLDDDVRRSQSGWGFVEPGAQRLRGAPCGRSRIGRVGPTLRQLAHAT